MTGQTASVSRGELPMSFIGNTLERHSGNRTDAVWIKSLTTLPDSRFVLSTATRFIIPLKGDHPIGHTLETADALSVDRNELVFLGTEPDGRALFATTIPKSDEDLEDHTDIKCIDLRALALDGRLPPASLGALAHARAMIHWHRTHRFCSQCGHPSNMTEAGYRRDCPSCGAQHFPRTDPCVIMLITDGDRALLGRPPRLAPGIFTTLAGFMEPGETIEQAVRRETMEEAGIAVGDVRIISNQPWPFPANLMIGCLGKALSFDITMDDDELEACRWCNRDEVRQMIAEHHPNGDMIPPFISIAHQLITGWVDGTLS